MSRVLFLIRSLDVGGAERQLVQLAIALQRKCVETEVLVFYDGGLLRSELEHANVQVFSAGKRGRWDLLTSVTRLVRHIRERRPDVIYSFMSSANILAVLCRPMVPGVRVFWGVRASQVDVTRYDLFARCVAWLERRLSRFASVIVANSNAGRDHSISLGFPADRIEVIVNGIDTGKFRFDCDGRDRVRREWSIGEGGLLIGIAARIDPMKGYEDFLDAAALVLCALPMARFVCVGDGDTAYRAELVRRTETLGISERVIWAGLCSEMPAIFSAFDISCSTSRYEGFSNSIAEAMSCERLCVVTDVGDSAAIVGDTGIVVGPCGARAVAGALTRAAGLSTLKRAALGRAARCRITRIGSMARLVDRTAALIDERAC